MTIAIVVHPSLWVYRVEVTMGEDFIGDLFVGVCLWSYLPPSLMPPYSLPSVQHSNNVCCESSDTVHFCLLTF